MSLQKNAIFSILLNVSNVLFPFITTPYVSRILGVENVGVVNFATVYAAYFVLFAMLGVPTYGIRIIAKYQETNNEHKRLKVFWELFTLISLCTFIVSIIYVGSIFTIPKLYEQKDFLLISGLTVFLASLNIEWYFGGREQFKWITIRSLTIKLLMIVGLFVFVTERDDVIPYLWLTIGSTLLNHIWNWIYVLKKEVKKIPFKIMQFKYHFKPLLLLFASYIAISIYTMLDTLMLGFISTYEQVGYYTSAMKISRVVMPIVTAMSPVVIARISSLKENNDITEIKSVLQSSFNYMYVLAVPITIGLFVIAPRFVPLFFGSEFIPSTLPLQLLSLLIIIIGISNIYGSQLVQAMGHDKLFLYVVTIGTVTNFSMNFVLINLYGATGAALASVVSETLILVLMYYVSLRVIRLSYSTKTLLQPIISSLPIVICSLILNYLSLTDLEYMIIVVTFSIMAYISLMMFVFKNEVITNVGNKVLIKLRLKNEKI